MYNRYCIQTYNYYTTEKQYVAFKQFIYRLLLTYIPILWEESCQWVLSTESTVMICAVARHQLRKKRYWTTCTKQISFSYWGTGEETKSSVPCLQNSLISLYRYSACSLLIPLGEIVGSSSPQPGLPLHFLRCLWLFLPSSSTFCRIQCLDGLCESENGNKIWFEEIF